MSRTALAGFLFLVLILCPAAARSEPASAFAELRALVGDWEGQSASGRRITVTYRLIANDSVLVESWSLSPTRQSMTVYHMDGEELLATHYCPLGNQPRLQLERSEPQPGVLSFRFRDATNLPDPAGAHQHAFWIRIQSATAYERSETYIENGEEGSETIVYTRVR